MKKIALLVLVLFTCSGAAKSQLTKIGGGLGYTTGYTFDKADYDYNKSGHLNFYAATILEVNLPFHIAPSLTYFLPHVWKYSDAFSESRITVSTLMIDVNGHYVFNSLDRFEFYGLAGLDILLAWKKDNFKSTSATNPVEETIREKDNAIGLNLGVGTYMKITESMDLNIEAKYLLSKYGQFMINAGVLFNLQYLNKKEREKGSF
jgi:opacity protein-like surface antigen